MMINSFRHILASVSYILQQLLAQNDKQVWVEWIAQCGTNQCHWVEVGGQHYENFTIVSYCHSCTIRPWLWHLPPGIGSNLGGEE